MKIEKITIESDDDVILYRENGEDIKLINYKQNGGTLTSDINKDGKFKIEDIIIKNKFLKK